MYMYVLSLERPTYVIFIQRWRPRVKGKDFVTKGQRKTSTTILFRNLNSRTQLKYIYRRLELVH